MDEKGKPQVGYKVEGEVLSVKGTCSWGHKKGDTFALSGYDAAGLCGFFYHDLFPYILMLQFGGGYPAEWGGPEVIQLACMDKANEVTIQLRRIKA